MYLKFCLVWLLVQILSLLSSPVAIAATQTPAPQVGAAQLEQYLPLLTNKRVGVVVNQTSRAHNQHLVDLLLAHGIKIQYIFAPEHGFRGDHDAGQKVTSSTDSKTGIPIISIYGQHKKPSAAIMSKLDIIVFDIQDVGVRFYTYISSMHYMMQAAAEHQKPFVVLDRPNPNIQYINGPILEPAFRSFVGLHPIPISHGMTIGELAKMILGEGWLSIESSDPNFDEQLALTVIPVANYTRAIRYTLPIPPSPNLPSPKAVQLYPSLCLFEATPISIGRGTDWPFQVVGHNKVSIGSFTFKPRSIKQVSTSPKLQDLVVTGTDLRHANITGFDLDLFIKWYRKFSAHDLVFFERPGFMDKLSGTDKLRKSILAGHNKVQIEASWQTGLRHFMQQRQPYLIYANH